MTQKLIDQIAQKLRDFRLRAEQEATDGGQPVGIEEIECTLATALSDVCDVLGLSIGQRRQVLGTRAAAVVGE